jgi:hypothetical protein
MTLKTPAELQMEELKRLKASAGKRPVPPPRRVESPVSTGPAALRPKSTGILPGAAGAGGYELSEKKGKPEPALPVSRELYRRLLAKQKESKAFKRKRDMGDWAAELLLGLPFEMHRLSPEAKADFFSKMKEWAATRGLK